MMTAHRYSVHGLTLASDWVIPSLTPTHTAPDVALKRGIVPYHLQHALDANVVFEVNRREFLLRTDEALFYVHDGQEIIVQPILPENPARILGHVAGLITGALLYQRKLPCLHGSAVLTQRGAIVFLGDSGVGKSSLTAGFYQRGYGFVTDDLCALYPDGERWLLAGGYPQLKLTPQSVEIVGIDSETLANAQWLGDKHQIIIRERYTQIPVPIHAFIAFKEIAKRDTFTPLKGFNRLQTLMQEVYQPVLFHYIMDKTAAMEQFMRYAPASAVLHFSRSKERLSLAAIINTIETELALHPPKF